MEKATCTKEGENKYTATFPEIQGIDLKPQEHIITIQKKDHTFSGDIEYIWYYEVKSQEENQEEKTEEQYLENDEEWLNWLTQENAPELKCKAVKICSNCKSENLITKATEVKAEVEKATCTKEGKNKYTAMFSEEGIVIKQLEHIIIMPREEHKLIKTEMLLATCTMDGKSAYYTCSKCNHYFSDEKGSKEIAPNSWVIKAKGHHIVNHLKNPTDISEGSSIKSCDVCGYVQETLVLPKKTLMITLGKCGYLISDASKCKFDLSNAKKYEKYFKLDTKTGKVTTKKNYSVKISKSIPVKVTTGGQTYTVTVKIRISTPSIKIKKSLSGDGYNYKFSYKLKKTGAKKIKVRIEGLNTKTANKVLDKYLGKPNSDNDSYIYISKSLLKKLGNKVRFKIVVYYGKNVSEPRIFSIK